MPSYVYRGGPCDGRTITLATALADGAVAGCGGASYQFNSGNPGVLIWLDVGGGGGTTGGTTVDPRQVGRAWHKLTHALGVESAQAIRKSRAGRARVKRVVR
jgi:hypothetical protein